MGLLTRFAAALMMLAAAVFQGATASAAPPSDPAARAAYMTADRAALLQRIHPRWRDFQPRWHEEVCPFSRTAKYDRGRVSCGYVLVPENRRDPGSRLIRIAITKVKSIARGQPPAGAIALLAGGPGVAPAESAAGYAPERNPRQRALLELGDLYAVDQRGTGSSEAPLCRGLSGLNDVPLSLEHWQAYAAKMATCLEEGRSRGIDPDAYTTWDNALDFRDIRRALGLQQWNIFGVSYGTELGQMILRIDGDGIRAAILDSVVAPKTDDGMRRVHSAGFLAALRKLNEACADDKACAGRYGDLEALARKAVESYDAAPYTIEGLDREVYKDGKLVVNGPMVALALFQAFYESRAYAALPALLEALATRQADASLATYVEVLSPPIDYQFGRGMGLVAECAGSTLPLPDAIREQVRREPFWSNALLEQRWEELCARSSRPPADPLDAWTPLVTDRPVLLLSGALDPITPPLGGTGSEGPSASGHSCAGALGRASGGPQRRLCGGDDRLRLPERPCITARHILCRPDRAAAIRYQLQEDRRSDYLDARGHEGGGDGCARLVWRQSGNPHSRAGLLRAGADRPLDRRACRGAGGWCAPGSDCRGGTLDRGCRAAGLGGDDHAREPPGARAAWPRRTGPARTVADPAGRRYRTGGDPAGDPVSDTHTASGRNSCGGHSERRSGPCARVLYLGP